MRFRFRAFWGMNFFFVVTFLLVTLIVFKLIHQGDYRGACALGGGSAVVFGFLFYLNIITCSDLVVTDTGMFRNLFGMRFRYTNWTDVKSIVVLKISRSGIFEEREIINIYRDLRAGPFLLLSGGRIVIGDSVDGFITLRRILNSYIDKYKIDVKVDDGMSVTSAKEIN